MVGYRLVKLYIKYYLESIENRIIFLGDAARGPRNDDNR